MPADAATAFAHFFHGYVGAIAAFEPERPVGEIVARARAAFADAQPELAAALPRDPACPIPAPGFGAQPKDLT